MDIRDQLIQELDDARARMQALISEIDSEIEVYSGWTVKELLAHITGWDDLVINTLNRHLTGAAPVMAVNRGIVFYNSTTVSEREGLDFKRDPRCSGAIRVRKAPVRSLALVQRLYPALLD
jgi:hypothetical protein